MNNHSSASHLGLLWLLLCWSLLPRRRPLLLLLACCRLCVCCCCHLCCLAVCQQHVDHVNLLLVNHKALTCLQFNYLATTRNHEQPLLSISPWAAVAAAGPVVAAQAPAAAAAATLLPPLCWLPLLLPPLLPCGVQARCSSRQTSSCQ
jgi:hypothetical protein